MKQRLNRLSAGERQDVYRQATKAIRAYGVVQPLDLLSPIGLSDLVHSAFLQYEAGLKTLGAADSLHPAEQSALDLESQGTGLNDGRIPEIDRSANAAKKPSRSLLSRLLSRD